MGRRPGSREVSTTRLILVGCVLVSSALASCKPRQSTPAEEQVTSAATNFPSPMSKAGPFAVGDDVSVIDDDGGFHIDIRVTAVTPAGYEVVIGSNRYRQKKVLPAARVFAAPWGSAARVKAGETIYEMRFGNFKPSKCIVTDVPADARQSIKAVCDGADKPQTVARNDTFYAIEPATLATVSPGQIVRYAKTSWVMVMGKSDAGDRIGIRATGYGPKDQLVPISKLEVVR